MSKFQTLLKEHIEWCKVNNTVHWKRYNEITERYYDLKHIKSNPIQMSVLNREGIVTPLNAIDGIVIPFEKYNVRDWNVYKYDDATIRHTHFFNPSIIMYNKMLLCAFRGENKNFFNEKMIYISILDSSFVPLHISVLDTAYVNDNETDMNWKKAHNGDYCETPAEIGAEDPRLYIRNGKLHILYCDGCKLYDARVIMNGTNHFHLEKIVDYTEAKLYMKHHGFKMDNTMYEKNWSIFSGDDDNDENITRFCYSLKDNEHIVIECDANHGSVIRVHRSWCPGVRLWDKNMKGIRGGTPSYILPESGGAYRITFFHTNTPRIIDDKSVVRLYYTGFYIFKNTAPYSVVKICDKPIIAPNAFPPCIPTPCAATIVTFPGGAVYSEEHKGWFISYGFNDYQSRVTFVQNDLINFKPENKKTTSSCTTLL